MMLTRVILRRNTHGPHAPKHGEYHRLSVAHSGWLFSMVLLKMWLALGDGSLFYMACFSCWFPQMYGSLYLMVLSMGWLAYLSGSLGGVARLFLWFSLNFGSLFSMGLST